jgi:hypothetical protein
LASRPVVSPNRRQPISEADRRRSRLSTLSNISTRLCLCVQAVLRVTSDIVFVRMVGRVTIRIIPRVTACNKVRTDWTLFKIQGQLYCLLLAQVTCVSIRCPCHPTYTIAELRCDSIRDLEGPGSRLFMLSFHVQLPCSASMFSFPRVGDGRCSRRTHVRHALGSINEYAQKTADWGEITGILLLSSHVHKSASPTILATYYRYICT